MAKFLIAGLVGHPVSHSLSPEIFSFLSRRLLLASNQKNASELLYGVYDTVPAQLESILDSFTRNEFFIGCNVTIPFKERAAQLCQRLSPEARATGAVNVLHFKNEKKIGFNSDVLGIVQTLAEQKARIKAQHCVVFGAGGAAAAVVYVLAQQGAGAISVVNRDEARAEQLIQRFSPNFKRCTFRAWSLAAFKCVDAFERLDAFELFSLPVALYVNATPVGMSGFPAHRLLPKKVQSQKGSVRALAFDLVYRPQKTKFLADAQALKLKTVGGLDMLVWQALATWEIWMGPIAAKARVKKAVKAHLEKILNSSKRRPRPAGQKSKSLKIKSSKK